MNLRHALYALRKALGAEIVIADRRTVQLNPTVGVWVDALEFKRALRQSRRSSSEKERLRWLCRAIKLYKGPLLEGCYYDWVIEEQQWLRERFVDAQMQLAIAYLKQGRASEAWACCERVLAESPYHEEAYQRGMLALAYDGRPAEALQLYKRCQTFLAELHLEPSPAIQQVAEWIAQGKLPQAEAIALPYRFPSPFLQEGARISGEWAWWLITLGKLYRERGDFACAERLYREALAVSLRRRDLRALVEARIGVGVTLWGRGDLRRAYEELQRALQAARQLPNPRPLADALMNLGIVAMQRGRYWEAYKYYVEALRLYRRLRERRRVAQAFNNLAIWAYHREDYAKATHLFRRALTLAQRENDLLLAARALNNLGNLARRLGRLEEAHEHLLAALKFFEMLGEPREMANTLINLGAVALERGDLGEARLRLHKGVSLSREIGAQETLLYGLVRWAQLAQAEGLLERAVELAACVRAHAEQGSWSYRRAGKLLRNLKSMLTSSCFQKAQARGQITPLVALAHKLIE